MPHAQARRSTGWLSYIRVIELSSVVCYSRWASAGIIDFKVGWIEPFCVTLDLVTCALFSSSGGGNGFLVFYSCHLSIIVLSNNPLATDVTTKSWSPRLLLHKKAKWSLAGLFHSFSNSPAGLGVPLPTNGYLNNAKRPDEVSALTDENKDMYTTAPTKILHTRHWHTQQYDTSLLFLHQPFILTK